VAVQTRNARILVVVALIAVAALILPGRVLAPTTSLRPGSSSTVIPTPGPTESSTESAPIVVSTDDVTIDGVVIAGPLSSMDKDAIGIRASGTAAAPIRNLTIRNCTIKGFNTAIEARHVENLVIEGCLIEDAAYGGIMVFSGVGGRISGNTIRRIGYGIDVHGPDGNNAYGIALSRFATTDVDADPRSSDFVVSGNVVEDIPLWHGLDTHAGSQISFLNNVIRRCARPIFITRDSTGLHPQNITVTGNRLEEAVEVRDGADKIAITLVNLQGGAVTNNIVSTTYPAPWVYDYLGLDPAGSVNVTMSGQTTLP
jgi:hypothetical protein